MMKSLKYFFSFFFEQRKPIRYLIILLQDQVINKTEINQHQNKLYLFCLIEQGRLRSESSS
jgi:hypothetical protein